MNRWLLDSFMARYFFLISRFFVIAALGGGAPILAKAGPVVEKNNVARVVFVQGVVEVDGPYGIRRLALGDVVYEKERVRTALDAYLYLRTVDDGFLVLRPGSVLAVSAYYFDPADLNKTVIQLRLDHGVLRSLTGKGGEAARNKYRVNTPVAAIGIKGTDYTLYTDTKMSAASVAAGAISMAGFSPTCSRDALGPCRGDNVKILTENQKDFLLQMRHGQVFPVLLPLNKNQQLAPDKISPPLPNEPSLSTLGAQSSEVARVAAKRETEVEGLRDVVTAINQPIVSTLRWGRWQPLIDQAQAVPAVALAELVGKSGVELIALDPTFIVGRIAAGGGVVPSSGQYQFVLRGSGVLLQSDNGAISSAVVDRGRLGVNMATRRFDTSIDLRTQGQVYSLWTKGDITTTGELISDYFLPGSSLTVRGALGTDAREAAYLFQGRVDNNRTATGVTYWRR